MEQLFLTIRHRNKGIPYGAGDRSDGSRNYGYKRLKGNTDLVTSIPEAQDMDALSSALVRINDPRGAFFSVGCEKFCNVHDNAFWVRGYFELAFNYIELVSDAQNYFKLFFEFSAQMARVATELPKAQYEFQLEPAHFLDGPATGFTLCVWINTPVLPTRDAAICTWDDALSFLVDFLEPLIVRPDLTPIYAPGKSYATL